MRARNWKKYNKQLVQRGSITLLIEKDFFRSSSRKRKKSRGRPQEFSLLLIHALLLCKIRFGLSYRALEGFAKSIFPKIYDAHKLPTYSLICRRARLVKLPKLPQAKSCIVLLDSSGMKVCGEGEWKTRIHGKSYRRKWIKLHIAVDPETQDILSAVTTECNVNDGRVVDDLLGKVEGKIKEVAADGAYDSARHRLKKWGLKELIPPPRNARHRNTDRDRDKSILEILGLGNDELARSIWGKLTGYNQRVLVETAFSRMKRLFGDRLFSKRSDNQSVENHLRCELINRMNRISA